MAGGCICRLFTTPLQRLLHTASLRHVEYYPYLGNSGRGLLSNLPQTRNMTSSMSAPGKPPTRKGTVVSGLDGALRLGKSSKKQRSKGKNSKQSGHVGKQINLLYPSCKTGSFIPSTRAVTKHNERSPKPTAPSRHKPKSTFLSSLSKQQREIYATIQSPTSSILNTKQVSSRVGREDRSRNQTTARFGSRDDAVASVATHSLHNENSIPLMGSSVDADKLETIKNYTDPREKPFGFEMDKKGSRLFGGVDRFQMDLVGDIWAVENCSDQDGVRDKPINNQGKWKENEDGDGGLKEVLSLTNEKDRHREVSKQRNNDGCSEDMHFAGYEHMLYNEARYKKRPSYSNAEHEIKQERGPQKEKPQDAILLPAGTVVHESQNTSADEVLPLKHAEHGNSPSMVMVNKQTTSFVLVDDLEMGKRGAERLSTGTDRVDSFIQSLQINDRWENVVQRELGQQRPNPLTPYEFIKNRSHHLPSLSENDTKVSNLQPSANGKCDNVFPAAHDQTKNNVFVCPPKTGLARNVSTVPNNTALLSMNQVCVEELKPDVKQGEPSRVACRAQSNENRLVSQPMLVIQPNEMTNRKKQNASMIDEQKLDSDPTPPSQHGVKKSNLSSCELEKKSIWRKRLLSAQEIAQKKSGSVGKDILPRSKSEIWSSSDLWSRKKEREKKKKSKLSASSSNCLDRRHSGIEGNESCGKNNVLAEKLNEASNIFNKESQLSHGLRERIKSELREKFVQMHRDKLLKTSLNSIKPCTLTSGSNNYVKWNAEMPERVKRMDTPPVCKKPRRTSSAPTHSLKGNKGLAIDKDTESKNKIISRENWMNNQLDPYEDWTRHQEKRYHEAMVQSLQQSQKQKPKKKKSQKLNKKASLSKSVSEKSQQDTFLHKHPESSQTFRFHPNIDTTLNRLQKSKAVDSNDGRGQLFDRPSSSRLPAKLNGLDGFMTMTLEPVADPIPPSVTNGNKVTKRVHRNSPRAGLPANQVSRGSLSTNQEPSGLRRQVTFKDTAQHSRNMSSATRRFHQRIGKEKEDKKKKNKRKRNLAEHTRTKRSNGSLESPKKT